MYVCPRVNLSVTKKCRFGLLYLNLHRSVANNTCLFTCWFMNSPVNVNILTSLELGQEPQQAVELLLSPVRLPGKLVLEVSVEEQPDFVLGPLNQRTLLEVIWGRLAGAGEDEEHVQGAELHVVPHDVPQGVQGLREKLFVWEILCPWRLEQHLNSIAFNGWNMISKRAIASLLLIAENLTCVQLQCHVLFWSFLLQIRKLFSVHISCFYRCLL